MYKSERGRERERERERKRDVLQLSYILVSANTLYYDMI